MRISLLLLFLLSIRPAKAAIPELLQLAQEAYAKGEYAQALAAYDSLDQHATSASLLFNIGNCHMKLGELPKSILYYERAIRLQPGADDIQSNLDFARSKVVDRVNELPALTLGSVWDRMRGGKDVDQWARRSLWAMLITVLLASLAVAISRSAIRRALIPLAAIFLLITVVSVFLAGYRVAEVTDRSQAVIMAPKVDVRGEPRDGSTTVFVLHEGTKVSVLSEQNGWSEIKLSSGSVGWAAPGSLEII
ncbi:MAG: tetratricopeptide repeat protein [Flavobacteriales bacterium]|nr:tetratricopeptide repeat protein [Flavobacteriales bacterium]